MRTCIHSNQVVFSITGCHPKSPNFRAAGSYLHTADKRADTDSLNLGLTHRTAKTRTVPLYRERLNKETRHKTVVITYSCGAVGGGIAPLSILQRVYRSQTSPHIGVIQLSTAVSDSCQT